ncbi:MAG: hypothetical protein L3J82_09775, partial [Planctomycetes bacterium]|nr:hypothetical protein [Planctomycetota bacterium]
MTQNRILVLAVFVAGITSLFVFIITGEAKRPNAVDLASCSNEAPQRVIDIELNTEQDEQSDVQSEPPALSAPISQDSHSAARSITDMIFSIRYREQIKRAERVKRLNELLASVFGHIPENPITELGKLSEEELASMTRSSRRTLDQAADIGYRLGEVYEPDNLLRLFEEAETVLGIRGDVTANMFSRALSENEKKFRESDHLNRRALAIVESYLQASKGEPVSIDFTGSVRVALEKLSPSAGALELIRRWTVETPHGSEVVETGLVEMLKLWPASEVTPVLLEILSTHRAGAVKGVVRIWLASGRKFKDDKWTQDDVRQILAEPLVEAIKKTKSSAAVFYARIFTGKDLLKHRAAEIAEALLARRDSVGISSVGLEFLACHDQATGNQRWREWFNSDDQYKVLTACVCHPQFMEVAIEPVVSKRMLDLATNPDYSARINGNAAQAVLHIDGNFSRCASILSTWFDGPRMPELLSSAGRLVVWGRPKSEVHSLLLDTINDPHRAAEDRYYPMLLLATHDPSKALSICEDKNFAGKLTEETILLVAAAAEGMKQSLYWQRGKKLRESIVTPEPVWMKNIRRRISGPNKRTE